MATQLIKAGGAVVFVGNIDGKEVAMSANEIRDYLDMYFITSSDDDLARRAKDLLRDFLLTALRDVRAETF